MKPRRTTTNKTPRYQGDGKFKGPTFSGGMFPRDMTDEEKEVAECIKTRFGEYLSEYQITAGMNRGKPIFMLRLENGLECETYDDPWSLVTEVEKLLERHGVEAGG